LIKILNILFTLSFLSLNPDKEPEKVNEVVLEIDNISAGSGYVMVAVYNSEDDFLSDRIYYKARLRVEGKKSQSHKLQLPNGEYAIAVYQDVNSDNILNKTFLGIPKEPYGFSGSPYIKFRPPYWSDTALRIDKDERIRISID
jgi:uncharacterized protein (DUF2141 family)